MEVSGWVRRPYQDDSPEPARERVLEGRLVLSQQVGPFDFAANAIIEADLNTGTIGFGYSLGVMWTLGHPGPKACDLHAAPGAAGSAHGKPESECGCSTSMPDCGCSHCAGEAGPCTCSHAGMVGVGLELFGGLGDSRAFGISGNAQEHYLGPVFMVHLTSHLMVHAQLAIGLTPASDDLVRLNVAYEF